MSWTPILHVSGRFRFQMPGYNNDPTNQPVAFDPNRPAADVQLLCECDPAKYFQFTLFDVNVKQVTYGDGTVVTNGDPVINMPVNLSGFMVDISPSAICAQIFPVQFSVGTLLQGTMAKAIQSDLRLSIRPLGFGDETAAAHFETTLQVAAISAPPGSRFAAEITGRQLLTVYLHLNHYTRMDNTSEPDGAHLTGDVYGYVRPYVPMLDDAGFRLGNRRLVAHPGLRESPDIEREYLLEGIRSVIRITDIDGSYDFSSPDRLLALRYLDFVPFLDRSYKTPDVGGYSVSVVAAEKPAIEVGRFLGTYQEMLRTGGLVTMTVPSDRGDEWALSIDVIRSDSSRAHLVLESEWDIALQSERGLILSSGESTTVEARVYQHNRPAPGIAVATLTQTQNGRSPIVARFDAQQQITDAGGIIHALVIATDLNATGGIQDPVTNATENALPIDRYYGNYVYLRIPNPLRRTTPAVEEIELAVRVLHKFDPSAISNPGFTQHIRPLFAYYLRYYPWLHVRHAGSGYARFLNLDDVQSVRDLADEIVRRLGVSLFDSQKMPRSRDFPIGGRELFEKWVASGMSP